MPWLCVGWAFAWCGLGVAAAAEPGPGALFPEGGDVPAGKLRFSFVLLAVAHRDALDLLGRDLREGAELEAELDEWLGDGRAAPVARRDKVIAAAGQDWIVDPVNFYPGSAPTDGIVGEGLPGSPPDEPDGLVVGTECDLFFPGGAVRGDGRRRRVEIRLVQDCQWPTWEHGADLSRGGDTARRGPVFHTIEAHLEIDLAAGVPLLAAVTGLPGDDEVRTGGAPGRSAILVVKLDGGAGVTVEEPVEEPGGPRGSAAWLDLVELAVAPEQVFPALLSRDGHAEDDAHYGALVRQLEGSGEHGVTVETVQSVALRNWGPPPHLHSGSGYVRPAGPNVSRDGQNDFIGTSFVVGLGGAEDELAVDLKWKSTRETPAIATARAAAATAADEDAAAVGEGADRIASEFATALRMRPDRMYLVRAHLVDRASRDGSPDSEMQLTFARVHFE